MWPFIKFGAVQIPTYPLLISFGICISFYWGTFRAKKFFLRREEALDGIMCLVVGALVGGRLFHVFFEHFDWYLSSPLTILMIWRGGFVYFGGFVGAFTTLIIFAKKKKMPPLYLIEVILPLLTFCMMIGRLGCFSVGCCYGTPTDLPWGIHFLPGSLAPVGQKIHPTQLYESLFWGALTLFLLYWEKRQKKTNWIGQRFGVALMLSTAMRFFIEFLRNDDRGGFFWGLSQAQVLSVWFFLVGLVLVLVIRAKLPVIESWTRSIKGGD